MLLLPAGQPLRLIPWSTHGRYFRTYSRKPLKIPPSRSSMGQLFLILPQSIGIRRPHASSLSRVRLISEPYFVT